MADFEGPGETPYAVIAMRSLLPGENREKRRLLRGIAGPLAGLLVWFAPAYMAIRLYLDIWSGGYGLTGGLLFLILAALLAGAGEVVRVCLRLRRQDEERYRAMTADEPDGKTLYVFDDRLEVAAPFGVSVYPFAQVRQVLVSEEVLVLRMRSDELVLRGLDMTAQQATGLCDLLYARIPAERIRVRRTFVGHQFYPLPPSPPEPFAQDRLFAAQVWHRPRGVAVGRPIIWSVASAVLIAIAALPWEPGIFENLFLDLPVLFAVILAAEVGLWALFAGLAKPPEARAVSLVWTAKGLITEQDGIVHFYRPEHVTTKQGNGGVWITIPGDRILVAWNTLQDQPAAMEFFGWVTREKGI